MTLKAGHGFSVSQDFARAKTDTPIELHLEEFAKPRCVIGYIAEDKNASLGFLRYGHQGKVRVHVEWSALKVAADQITLEIFERMFPQVNIEDGATGCKHVFCDVQTEAAHTVFSLSDWKVSGRYGPFCTICPVA